MRLHGRKLGTLDRRHLVGMGKFDMHELAGHRLAQPRDHVLEQGEGLALVLVQRISLAVAPESHHLAEMLDHQKMLSPKIVERL